MPTLRTQTRFRFMLLLLVLIIGLGTFGYMLIEDWKVLDALYMTVITLATVGFREVHQLTPLGQIFTVVLIVFGVGGVIYTIGTLAQLLIEGELQELLGRRKMEKQLQRIRDHYIICGYGRVGKQVCREFRQRRVPFVVVEKDPALLEELTCEGVIYLQGDSTEDHTLIEAGIERAKGLVLTIASEADNVFVTLTARQLNPDVFITARADSPSAEKKIYRAGANKVVSPYIIGGNRMAIATLQPYVGDFLRLGELDKDTGLTIEEVQIDPGSPIAGKTLKDSALREETGFNLIGIKKATKEVLFNPPPDTMIQPGDILIIFGEVRKLEMLEKSGEFR
ncbi:MAG: potassium channel family protein [Candidatus Zixiibacteriota bacterium]